MKLSELIAEIGDDKVEFQMLSQCLIGSQKQTKHGINVTFATNAVSLADLVISDKPAKIGWVLWLPGDKVREIYERESSKPPESDPSTVR